MLVARTHTCSYAHTNSSRTERVFDARYAPANVLSISSPSALFASCEACAPIGVCRRRDGSSSSRVDGAEYTPIIYETNAKLRTANRLRMRLRAPQPQPRARDPGCVRIPGANNGRAIKSMSSLVWWFIVRSVDRWPRGRINRTRGNDEDEKNTSTHINDSRARGNESTSHQPHANRKFMLCCVELNILSKTP